MYLIERLEPDSCPYGGVFYKCSLVLSGFTGCCLKDPCSNKEGGCPDDKDRTPARYTLASTTTISATVTTQDPSASFVKLPISTGSILLQSSSASLATESASSFVRASTNTPLPTLSHSVTGSPTFRTGTKEAEETAAGVAYLQGQKADPKAIIVSAIIGGTVLVALGLFLLVWMRRRKHQSAYQARIYVSPFNTSGDVPIDSPASDEVKDRTQLDGPDVQELEGRNVSNEATERQRAELHGESLTRI